MEVQRGPRCPIFTVLSRITGSPHQGQDAKPLHRETGWSVDPQQREMSQKHIEMTGRVSLMGAVQQLSDDILSTMALNSPLIYQAIRNRWIITGTHSRVNCIISQPTRSRGKKAG